uniref:Uncharacterized protein n=1 Tax=Salix viminalis TaxID=40686 RepID=A0A6N2N4T5_SALVM
MEAITVSRQGFCLHSVQEVTEELSSIGSLYHLITVVTDFSRSSGHLYSLGITFRIWLSQTTTEPTLHL